MDKQEYRDTAYRMLGLIARVVGVPDCPPLPEEAPDLSALYTVAKAHSLCAVTGAALQAVCHITDADFREACAKSLRKSILIDTETKKISACLCQQHIRHLPLKGIVLKDLYPRAWMREMADVDILFEPEKSDAVKAIMLQNGYTAERYQKSNEDIYTKKPHLLFEMHRELFDRERFPELYAYFSDLSFPIAAGSPYLWEMTAEETYLYLIAHLSMHFHTGGTGLRSLLDIYLYLDRYGSQLDFDHIANELEPLGTADFEKKIRSLSQNFLRGPLSQEESDLLDYFIFSGTYGNISRYVRNRIARSMDGSGRSKQKYLRKRLALPDNQLREHPFYLKHPRLRPVLSATRIFKAVVTKPKALIREAKELIKAPNTKE